MPFLLMINRADRASVVPQLAIGQHINFAIFQYLTEKWRFRTTEIEHDFATHNVVAINTNNRNMIKSILVHPSGATKVSSNTAAIRI